MQVEWTNAVKHEDAYLRDQQFEFAASQLITLLYIICVLSCVTLINCYTSLEDILCLWTLCSNPDPIGVGITT